MGRCWGITGTARNLNLCHRRGKWWFFCPEHKRQPLYALFGIVFASIAGTASIYSCNYGATTQDVYDATNKILQRQEDTHHRGRPNVFFKWTKFYESLGKSDTMAIEIWLSNSGTEDARGSFTGISFRFETPPYSKTLEFQRGGANGTFDLAPSQDTYIRLGSTLPLTLEMIKALTDDPPNARLYIFARGWYSDIAETKNYELPLCRVFHPTMPGNLIYCPDDVTVKDPEGE